MRIGVAGVNSDKAVTFDPKNGIVRIEGTSICIVNVTSREEAVRLCTERFVGFEEE